MAKKVAGTMKLQCASLDLGLEKLAWAVRDGDREIEPVLQRRKQVFAALIPEARRMGCSLCHALRHPAKPVTQELVDITLQFIEDVGNPGCGLMLTVVLDELQDLDPAAVLTPFLEELAVLRIHYEPALGIRFAGDDQQRWAQYLKENEYTGDVVFAPAAGALPVFAAELPRIASDQATYW